jgi:tRNA G18 (ribose-2'-O)-methylase SpoU
MMIEIPMGYFEIGIFQPTHAQNVGTLWRSAYQLGAAGIFTIGRRYTHQPGDMFKVPHQIPLRQFLTLEEFLQARPEGAQLVGIEMGGTPLAGFRHPRRAIYILGAEDNGLAPKVIEQCNHVISIEAVNRASYNLAVAGSIVMYHRLYLETVFPKEGI